MFPEVFVLCGIACVILRGHRQTAALIVTPARVLRDLSISKDERELIFGDVLNGRAGRIEKCTSKLNLKCEV